MRFIQAIIAIVAFTGYIIYQLVIKKKKIGELQNDIIAIAFFAFVWIGIYYWMK